MKKIIISLLTNMGMGINAKITDPNLFIANIKRNGVFTSYDATIEDCRLGEHFTLKFSHDSECFRIYYNMENGRVTSMDISEEC